MPIQNDKTNAAARRAVQSGAAGARFVGAVFGFVFAGIGLTTLIFLWGFPFGEFGSPPIFFRIFGSFIAIAFVAVGGTLGVTAIKGRLGINGALAQMNRAQLYSNSAVAPSVETYTCPHCGAPLPAKSDVSPLGDAKCPFCQVWFNIHQKTV